MQIKLYQAFVIVIINDIYVSGHLRFHFPDLRSYQAEEGFGLIPETSHVVNKHSSNVKRLLIHPF